MKLLIAILVIIVGIVIWSICISEKRRKEYRENIERRKKYAEKLGENTRVIVNNGVYFFFKNDVQQFFGVDESGKVFSFSGLHSVQKYKESISFMHEDSVSICVGKNYCSPEGSFPLDVNSINLIYKEMMPILRKNLQKELDQFGITPTYEYENDGEIWGCDINSKQFYCAYGNFNVFKFSDLKRVTVDDLRDNKLFAGSYIIHLYVKDDYGYWDSEFEISIMEPNATYYNLLAMFKGIRNRQ